MNWPQVDYTDAAVLDGPDDGARALSRSFLHWMQTEGGFPGLRLRGDVVGDTPDGLAKAPYIREARRIRALRTVVEQDIALDVRGAPRRASRSPTASASATTGSTCTRRPAATRTSTSPAARSSSRSARSCPSGVENLLAAGKCLGTTHITNGAYRLHPVEWNAGEAAGHLAAFCRERRTHAARRLRAARPARARCRPSSTPPGSSARGRRRSGQWLTARGSSRDARARHHHRLAPATSAR